MSNLWYFLVGFLLGDSSSSQRKSKSSKGKIEYSPETVKIVMMIAVLVVIILAIIMLRTMLSYQQ